MAFTPRTVRLLAALAGWLGAASARAAPPSPADHFEKNVRPLLSAHCWKCHGPEASKGGLRLDSAAGVRRGGDSGPVVVAGKPDESRLIQAVRRVGELKMPPDAKLSDRQVADLTTWVKSGAVWPETAGTVSASGGPAFSSTQRAHWAFQPVTDPPIPTVHSTENRNPIDRFILSKLEGRGLTQAPPANKRTLIRRVSFDLTGLPPTPAEIDAYLGDNSPDAYAKLIDRLLASPHYGERWGRHWLDVVRYAETTANDANAVMRFAWRYRDYVVDAFHRDLPYDQFIVEQLAGDLLPVTPDKVELARHVIATGFLMVGPKALAETDKEQVRMDVVDEQLDVTGRAFLGLTIGCARCHDHKFDPLPAADYYGLAGIFRGTEVFRDDTPNAAMWQERALPVFDRHWPLVVMAPKDGKPTDLRIHLRGSRFNLGQVAPRHLPQILVGSDQRPFNAKQSGRLEFARWVASKDNPLTARVLVNRVWQHHFGTGLVATSDNFGLRGEAPSHPELLDWLASRLVESGWSIKALHRLVLTSATYRMSSIPNDLALRTDPNDRLLWRMPHRRLDAEPLRDAILAVSGRLDRRVGGGDSGEFLFREGEVIDKNRDFFRPNRVQADAPYYTQSHRRSLYLPVVRNAVPDVLAVFDAADPNAVTAARTDTTVPGQALYLLNHPFVREQALHFAQSLLANETNDTNRIRTAHQRALGRQPTDGETAEALAFLAAYQERISAKEQARLRAWQSYCQTLFCSNEFLYVD